MSGSTKTSPVKKAAKQAGSNEKVATDKGDAVSNGNSITKDQNSNEAEEPDHSILSDPEDYLEEDESLDMNLTNGEQKVWLVKLPRYLAEKWSNIDELSGEQLGRVKIKQSGRNGNNSGKLQVK